MYQWFVVLYLADKLWLSETSSSIFKSLVALPVTTLAPPPAFKTSTAANFGLPSENDFWNRGAAMEENPFRDRGGAAVQTRTPSGSNTGAHHRLRRWKWRHSGRPPRLQHWYATVSWRLASGSAANVFSIHGAKVNAELTGALFSVLLKGSRAD